MRIAITGARGRLAPVLASYLRERGAVVDRFSRTGGDGFLALGEFPAGTAPDWILHCAWSTVPFTAEADPASTEREDLPLLRRVLEACPTSGIVFLSTAAIYGDTGPDAADEARPPAPLGAYARGKLAGEALVRELRGDRALILRVTNLLGEASFPRRPQGILPRLVHAARSQEPVEIWGDGSTAKDYLHSTDFCRAVEALLAGGHHGVYNVGSGLTVSLNTLIGMVQARVGRPSRASTPPAFRGT